MVTFGCQKGHHQESTRGFQLIFVLIKNVNLWFTDNSSKRDATMASKKVPFYVRVRSLRESRGLSYRKMASELKDNYGIAISATAIQKWEEAREESRLPTRDKISALCQMFNISPSFLLEELFGEVQSREKPDRLSLFIDLEMLTDKDFDALLQIKNSLIKHNNSSKPEEPQPTFELGKETDRQERG